MKNKLKPLVKEAKKAAQKSIHESLVVQLKEITSKLGHDSIKLNKKIEKEAKKLAKKFAKGIKIGKEALATSEVKATSEAKKAPKPAKTAAPVKAKAKPAAALADKAPAE